MIFKDEWFCNQPIFGYHITEEKNMLSIKEQGLKPLCGPRSESVGDIRKAIYFFRPESSYSLYDWIEFLYHSKDMEHLKLLRFSLMRRKLYEQCAEIGDFFVLKPILPEKIEYMRIFDSNGSLLSIDSERTKIKKIEWKPIIQYSSFTNENNRQK